jgi:hypothetical protein
LGRNIGTTQDVGVKYWDNPIIIGEMERFWGTAGVYFLPNIVSLLGKGRLLEMLLSIHTSWCTAVTILNMKFYFTGPIGSEHKKLTIGAFSF